MLSRSRIFQTIALAGVVLGSLVACNSILGTDVAEKTAKDAGTSDDEPVVTGEGDDDTVVEGREAGPCPGGDLSANADHCGVCGHSCLGGACKGGKCQPVVLAADRLMPADIARAGAYVYVAELGTATSHFNDGRITRVKVDGCKTNCTSKLTDVEGPVSVAVDSTTAYIAQWQAGIFGGSIMTAPIGGGEAKVFKTAQSRPRTIAFDQTALYWVNGGEKSYGGSVFRAFTFDAEPGDAGMAVVSELDYPFDIVVKNDLMYFTVAGEVDTDGEIHRAEINGSNDTVIATSQRQPRGLAFDGTYVYWVNRGNGTVHRTKAAGGGKDEEIMTGCNQPVSIAIDAVRVYVVESGSDPDYLDGRLVAADRDGKNKVVLATNLMSPRAVRLDEDAAYFVEKGSAEHEYRDGTLQRVAKP